MARQFSRYTPSLMPHDVLEDLYVPRGEILKKIAHRIDKAATTDGRNHTLLIGGRGAGKTHVISLAFHRAKALLSEINVQLAWLDEDPWLILSYEDLLAHIIARLEPSAEEDPGGDLAYFLRRRADKRGPIVVFTENFDQILDQIGDHGQQELRHLLQTHRSLLLVASTTNLAHHALQEQSAPFYGFMTEERLIPFQRAQAAAMLTNISTLNGNEELAVYLKTPAAASRLAVVEHLAGGAPRMWATLGTALDVDGLDDLVDHLMATFDDLTPYYQEQLARLSGHQRRVVAALGQLDRPMSTVDLAAELKIDQRSLSKTMHELKERGWVKPCESPFIALLDKRSTYYELAEPMARIAFQIKANRGEPLHVIVDFLKGWFEGAQLGEAVTASDMAASHLSAALAELERDIELGSARQLVGTKHRPQPIVLETLLACDRALEALQQGNATPYFALSAALRGPLELLADDSDATAVHSARWLIHIHAMLVANNVGAAKLQLDDWISQSWTLHDETEPRTRRIANALMFGWTVLREPEATREHPTGQPQDDPWVALAEFAPVVLSLTALLARTAQIPVELGPDNEQYEVLRTQVSQLLSEVESLLGLFVGVTHPELALGVTAHVLRTRELIDKLTI